MNLGWRGLLKVVAASVTLTSLAWIGLGVWWYQHRAGRNDAPSPELMQLTYGTGTSPTPTSSTRRVGPRADLLPPVYPPSQRLIIPVAGVSPAQLSDTFGQARADGERSHDAIDILAPLGTPVIAAAAGRVEKLLVSPAGGNTAYVRSPDGRTIYYYAHLDQYAAGLAEGQPLQQGSAIGMVGFSGNADPAAPHLHFAVLATAPERKWWDAATALNPYPLLK